MNENNNTTKDRKWKEFGDFLQELRHSKTLTRKDVAVGANKSESTVAAWEHGLRRPIPSTLLQLSHYLGIPIQRLQVKAGYTPEFDWINSLVEKPDSKTDILETTTDEEKQQLRQYLYFLRFIKEARKYHPSAKVG